MTETKAGAAPDEAAQLRELRLQRNLKIVVAALGLMILAGLAAVAVRVIGFGTKGAPGQTAAASPHLPQAGAGPGAGGEIALELPRGAKVVSTSIAGNRLAVHYESPAGTGIAILDLDTGKRIADVRPREALPEK
jgi:hypothetical protein